MMLPMWEEFRPRHFEFAASFYHKHYVPYEEYLFFQFPAIFASSKSSLYILTAMRSGYKALPWLTIQVRTMLRLFRPMS